MSVKQPYRVCPKCGTRYIWESKQVALAEWMKLFCQDCGTEITETRFVPPWCRTVTQ